MHKSNHTDLNFKKLVKHINMQTQKHIIFIDDDPGIQDSARFIFEKSGYRFTCYSNGNLLLKNETELPDLYILDKQLSGVDGIDICRFLKGQERTRNIPVIMLSASPHVAKLTTSAGANDFLEKPFEMRELREKVARLINNE